MKGYQEMKKWIIAFVLILIGFLASCSSTKIYEFKDLHVNISDAHSLAIAQTEVNRKDKTLLTSVPLYANEDQQTELVTVDENGNFETVEFLNSKNVPVDIDYSLYYFEIFGDFTYLIYYKTSIDKGHLDETFTWYYRYLSSDSNISTLMTLIEKFYSSYSWFENDIKKIAIHNDSGKIFDYSLLIEDLMDDGDEVTSFFINQNNQVLSKVKGDGSACIIESKYNSTTAELQVDEKCSNTNFRVQYAANLSNFIYYLNLPDQRNPGIEYMDNNIELNWPTPPVMIIKNQDGFILFFKEGNAIWYDWSFTVIDEKTILEDFDPDDQIDFQFYKTNNNNIVNVIYGNQKEIKQSFYNIVTKTLSESTILTTNTYFQTFFDVNNYSYFIIEDKQYLFLKSGIWMIDYDSQTVTSIASDITLTNISTTPLYFVQTGYIKYTYISGINQNQVIFDPFTNEIISETNNAPVRTTWYVKPLN